MKASHIVNFALVLTFFLLFNFGDLWVFSLSTLTQLVADWFNTNC